MQKKPSILNIVLIAIGLIVLIYGIFQKSETTVIANEIGEAVVQAHIDKVAPENNGKLVIVSGPIVAADNRTDDFFKISHKTIKMKRVVETYQWSQDCSTECTYIKVWSDATIDSSKFDDAHKNPDTQQYSSEEYVQGKVQLGAYTLSAKLIDDLHYDTTMGPDEIMEIYNGNYDLVGEYITNAADMDRPMIGDFRIHYEYVKDKDVTVVAKQAGESFEAYYTDRKKEIYDITEGEQTASEYIANLKKSNSLFGVIMVIVGAIFILFGAGAIIYDNLKAKKQNK